jgi:hypothetical protein
VWMDKFLGNKWSQINETLAFIIPVCFTTTTDLRQLDLLRMSLDVNGSKSVVNEVQKRWYHQGSNASGLVYKIRHIFLVIEAELAAYCK